MNGRRLPYPIESIPSPLRLPLVATVAVFGIVAARFATGNPLSSGGGELVYFHHRTRLQILHAWNDLWAGQSSLREFLQLADTEFPPFLHFSTLLLGAVFGHSAEVAIVSGVLWLCLLAASVGYITHALSRPGQTDLAPTQRSHRSSGSLAATLVLLMGCYQGFSLRYYYDLPMTALLWAGMAVAIVFWERRPILGGILSGAVVSAAVLTKWTALPFATAMAVGLVLTSFGLPGRSSARRARMVSLAVATAAAAVVCGTFLQTVDEGERQSSLSVMGGTFQSQSGRVLTGRDLKQGLQALHSQRLAPLQLNWTSPQMGSTAELRSYDWDSDGEMELVAVDQDRSGRIYRLQDTWGSVEPRLKLAQRWQAATIRPVGPPFGDWSGTGALEPTRRSDPNLEEHLNRNASQQDPSERQVGQGSETPPVYAWGDFDGDGDLDLAVGIPGDSLAVLRNQDGALAADAAWRVDEPTAVTSLSWGDWDGDGDQDLAMALSDGPNRLYANQDGKMELTWQSKEGDHSAALAWGDWDGDGDLDLAVANSLSEPNRLYENNGGRLNLSWTSAEADNSVALAWGDWDGDGDQDLAVANLDGPNRLYDSIGGGPALIWTSPAVDPSRSIRWHDWNRDGHPDLVEGNEGSNPDRVYRNAGPDYLGASDDDETRSNAGNTAAVDDDSTSAATSRLLFYPRWLLRSIFSLPLLTVLLLLALPWAASNRTGMALFACTALGQLAFLLTAVPPLDERFAITMAPVLVIAAAMGWGQLPAPARRATGIGVLALASVVALEFHFLAIAPRADDDSGPQLWTRKGMSLHTASYPDGGWKRGEDERALLDRGSALPWREARHFHRQLWDAVQNCGARTVVIGSQEAAVDDTDWWQYRVALADARADHTSKQRPGVHVIEGADVGAGNYLASAIGSSGVPDLAFSVPAEDGVDSPPSGIPDNTMVADHVLPARGRTPAVTVWRPRAAEPCSKK